MSDRPTLLLLPGNMCDERMWSGLLPWLGERAVAAPVPTEATIEAMAATCLERHPGRLMPVGFSMGGIVALAIARAAPDRVAALALLDTNAGADAPEKNEPRLRQQSEVRAGGLERVVAEELKPAYLAAENRSDAALLALLNRMATDLGPAVFERQSEALRTRPDLRDVLPSLDVPSFVACGAEDELCPPALHQALAESARDAELHVVPGAAHMLPLERPDELGHRLADWLTRVEKEEACTTVS